jgi:hypothetical protein
MKRQFAVTLLLAGGLFLVTAVSRAEVKTQEKNQFKMEGLMGRMMGMFAGQAAKEGVLNTVAVKGNRKITTAENTGEIIDLGEQKVYELDLKKKTYVVSTFDEMRRRLREAQEKAAKTAKTAGEDSRKEAPPSGKQMEFDFSMKESGQKRTINGYDCREVVMTIAGHEKGKTLEESGGMVMTSHLWIGPKIPAMNEISDFDMRYAKAMELAPGLGGSAEQTAMAMAMYPGMKDMMGKMQVESVNTDGTAILTEMTMEAVTSPAQMSGEQDQKRDSDSSSVTSIRGLGGLLGRKLTKKKEPETDPNKPQNRATIMTVSHELLKVETSVPDSDASIPAGFKEKK